jgi:hypothetical protein
MKKREIIRRLRAFLSFFLALFLVSACGDVAEKGSAPGSRTLKVNILDSSGKPVPRAIVVLGNENGSIFRVAITSPSGQVEFTSPPPNAIVTCPYNRKPGHGVVAYYDVDIPELSLQIDIASWPRELGSMKIHIRDQALGATYYVLRVGSQYYLSQTADIQVRPYPEDIGMDGSLSILAEVYSSDFKPLGYGIKTGVPFSRDSEVQVEAAFEDYRDIRYDFLGTSRSAELIWGSLLEGSNGGLEAFHNTWASPPIPELLILPAIPGFEDHHYKVRAWAREGGTRSWYELGRTSGTLADQIFDFSKAIPAPTGLSISDLDTGSPVFRWQGGSPEADLVEIYARFGDESGEAIFDDYHFFMPPKRKEAIFPQLPPEFEDFQPYSVDWFMVVYHDVDFADGYGDLIKKMGDYYRGAYGLPLEWNSMSSGAAANPEGDAPASIENYEPELFKHKRRK